MALVGKLLPAGRPLPPDIAGAAPPVWPLKICSNKPAEVVDLAAKFEPAPAALGAPVALSKLSKSI
jgi:hypothetical protein